MNASNISLMDSLHMAAAEAAQTDAMLTTDDKLEKAASKIDLKIAVVNPLKFMLEDD